MSIRIRCFFLAIAIDVHIRTVYNDREEVAFRKGAVRSHRRIRIVSLNFFVNQELIAFLKADQMRDRCIVQ